MILQDVPLNLAGSIFLAGLAVGVIITAAFLLIRGPAGQRGGEVVEKTPHDVIMAIKRRAAHEEEHLSLFGVVGMIFLIIVLFIVILAIIALGRYFSEGRPNGEEFIPYFLRIFVLPLQERLPFLQNM